MSIRERLLEQIGSTTTETLMPTVIRGPEERELIKHIGDVLRPVESTIENMIRTQLEEGEVVI